MEENHSLNLTERQIEVADLMVKGMERDEIAKILQISSETVKRHIHSILEKCEATNQKEATGRLMKDRFVYDRTGLGCEFYNRSRIFHLEILDDDRTNFVTTTNENTVCIQRLSEVASYFHSDGEIEWIEVNGHRVDFEKKEAGKYYYVSNLDREYKLGETFKRVVRTKMRDCLNPSGHYFFVDHTLPCQDFSMIIEIFGDRSFKTVEAETIVNSRLVQNIGTLDTTDQKITWEMENPKLFSTSTIRWTTFQSDLG